MPPSRTSTAVQEPPRSHSATDVRPSQFLVRTGQFFKKVSNIRSARRKSGDHEQFAAFQRSARSMEYSSKDYAALNNTHPAIHIDRAADTPSPNGGSSENGPESRSHGQNAVSGARSTTLSLHTIAPSSTAGHLRASSDGDLPRDQTLSQDDVRPIPRTTEVDGLPRSTEPTLQMYSHGGLTPASGGPTLPQLAVDDSASRAPGGTQGVALPLRTVSLGAAVLGSASTGASLSAMQSESPPSPGELSRSLSDRRSLAPRLATLPPPMMASFTAKGSTRLTPSVVSRQPPMPILNLPTLPPITSSQLPTRPRQQAPLRSIPALPMRGPSESQQEADHDNALLEDEEEDEEDDTDASPGTREADAGASDDEGEDSPGTPRSRGNRLPGLPQISTSRIFSRTEAAEQQNREMIFFTPQVEGTSTPVARRPGSSSSAATDYFTSKRADKEPGRSHSPSRTPRPADHFGSPSLRTPVQGNVPQGFSLSQGPSRPGMYHLGSRSMVDLLSSSKRTKDRMATPSIGPESTAERRRNKALPGEPAIEEDQDAVPVAGHPDPNEVISPPVSPTLRRQRSLPIYKLSSDPPPYPSFHPRGGPAVQPRDEEGMERLPLYSNSIYLAAIMPRKVEFSAPGVQAKDRKWRRVLCVLEGTAFRVYKPPPGAAGVSAIEEWWERKVGVGDITIANGGAVTQSGIRVSAVRGRGSADDRPGKDAEEPSSALEPIESSPSQIPIPPPPPPPPTKSKLSLAAASLLHPTRTNQSHRSPNSAGSRSVTSPTSPHNTSQIQSRPRASADIPQQEDHSTISMVPRSSIDERSSRDSGPISSSASRSTTSSSPPASDSASSFFSWPRGQPGSASSETSPPNSARSFEPSPSAKDLIRSYTLQQAESGLASDYSKRKNVIRIRMEGEQFLLQAHDVASVIDWIEGIQAATNIALDLDQRPMPKGPMFPRRRRRRARAAGEASAADATRSLRISTQANVAAS